MGDVKLVRCHKTALAPLRSRPAFAFGARNIDTPYRSEHVAAFSCGKIPQNFGMI
jgi:hypothetical protein